MSVDGGRIERRQDVAPTGGDRRPSAALVALAAALSATTIALGYVLLGAAPMLLFTGGFAGGFIAWLVIPTNVSFATLKWPYVVTLAVFVLHKLEERYFGFFPALSKLTGVRVPEASSAAAVALYACASTWLLVPVLVRRRNPFGHYLAWTFFTSMALLEPAHFVFPFLANETYRYFPGLVSAIPLVAAGFWGLSRLALGLPPDGDRRR